MDYAFEFITKQKGITTEANYPYRAQDGYCDANKVFFHIQLIWLMEVVNARA
jgi:KDEL-tailed cysteine endopeptidase